MMSPKTKKILLVGGAAVAAYVVYSMVTKKKMPPAKVGPALSPAARADLITNAALKSGTVAGIEDDLGTSEDLGSLQSRY